MSIDILETDRLILRPFTMNDVEGSYRMNLDEKVGEFTGDGGVVSKAEIERRIREDVLGDYSKYGYGRLVIELKSTKEFLGFAGLKYLSDFKEVDLGYRLMSQYWDKGYATEASRACLEYGFNKLKLKTIVAMVLPENKRSIHVLEKLQFTFEKQIIEDGLEAQFYRLKH